MTTTYTLNDGESGAVIRGKINDSIANLNSGKAETTALTAKQDTLISGTNIKTLNGVSVLGSGDITVPTLSDGDKGDITITGGVWAIDNDVVTFAKMQNLATNKILGRTTAGTGNTEELTPAQVAGMLPVATTSVAGTMSATDKTKVDSLKASGILYFTTTPVVVSNTVAFTSVGSATIPAGYLSGNAIRVKGWFTVDSLPRGDSRDDFAVKITYGGVDAGSTLILDRLDGDEQQGFVEITLYGTGTSTQISFAESMFTKTSLAAAYARPLVSYNASSSSIDSSVSQTLTVEVAPGNATTFESITMKSLIIEKI